MSKLLVVKKRKNSLTKKKNHQLLIIAFPALLFIFIFSYIPMGGIIIAFKNINYVDGIFKSPWVGFDNFRFFFTSSDAWIVVKNTLGYNFASIILGTSMAVIFALMLNELRGRFAIKLYQTVFFFPYFFSWVIVSYMVYSFMSGYPAGVFVGFVKQLGIDLTDFYVNPAYWPFFLIVLGVWKGLGYSTVIYYASIMGLSTEYFEAAAIDGATHTQIIRHITLPLITPIITTIVLLSVGKIFNSDFGLFYFIPRQIGYLIPVTQTIDTYVYRMLSTSSDLGMAAASGLFQSFMGFLCIIVSNTVVKKVNSENSIF